MTSILGLLVLGYFIHSYKEDWKGEAQKTKCFKCRDHERSRLDSLEVTPNLTTCGGNQIDEIQVAIFFKKTGEIAKI